MMSDNQANSTTDQPDESSNSDRGPIGGARNRNYFVLVIAMVLLALLAAIFANGHNLKEPSPGTPKVGLKTTEASVKAKNAFEALQLLSYYNLQAENNFEIPAKGIEYVNDIYNKGYIYPWLGTIISAGSANVTLSKQYTMGDKVQPSSFSSSAITIPTSDFLVYAGTKAVSLPSVKAGQIVAVWQSKLLVHTVGSATAPSEVSKYFAFTVDYSVAAIANSDPSNPHASAPGDYATDTISVPDSLGLSNRCVNNAADTCSFQIKRGQAGTGLYPVAPLPTNAANGNSGANVKTDAYNTGAIQFGEEVPYGQSQPSGIIQRNVQGVITSLGNDNLIIRTSSGALWTLAYSASKRKQFASLTGKELRPGDSLGGIVLSNINSLDNRSIDNVHIGSLSLLCYGC